MKNSFIPLLLLISATSFAQIQDFAAKNNRLSFINDARNRPAIIASKIKTEKVFVFAADDTDKIDSVLAAEYQYDSNGNMTMAKEYNGKTVTQKEFSYSFFPNGGIASKKIILIRNDRQHFTEVTYTEHGDELYCYDYDEDSTNMLVMKKDYNGDGKCAQIKFLDKDSSFKSVREYNYNNSGNLLQAKILLGSNNFLTAVYETTAGIEYISFDNKKIRAYSYDQLGRLEEENRPLYFLKKAGTGMLSVIETHDYANPFYTVDKMASLSTGDYNSTFRSSRLFDNRQNNYADIFTTVRTDNIVTVFNDNAQNKTGGEAIETRRYQYNKNGTISQIAVFVSGKPFSIIKHIYETR